MTQRVTRARAKEEGIILQSPQIYVESTKRNKRKLENKSESAPSLPPAKKMKKVADKQNESSEPESHALALPENLLKVARLPPTKKMKKVADEQNESSEPESNPLALPENSLKVDRIEWRIGEVV